MITRTILLLFIATALTSAYQPRAQSKTNLFRCEAECKNGLDVSGSFTNQIAALITLQNKCRAKRSRMKSGSFSCSD